MSVGDLLMFGEVAEASFEADGDAKVVILDAGRAR
jgi:hypothetical protein